MKKYHLFCNEKYYSAGANDYQKSFETLNETEKYFDELKPKYWFATIMETQIDGSLKLVSVYIPEEKVWFS